MDVEGLGQGELLGAVDLKGEHRVGTCVPQHGSEVMTRQFQVLRLAAMAVEHGGILPSRAHARGALTGPDVRTDTVSWLVAEPADWVIVSLLCWVSGPTARIATYRRLRR